MGVAARGRTPSPRRARRAGMALVAVLGLVAAWPLSALAVDVEGTDDFDLAIAAVRADAHPQVTVTVNVPQAAVDPDDPDAAFTLLEDGEPREVEVRRLDSEDLEVLLVLDTSGSMTGAPLDAARVAAGEFVASLPDVVPLGVIAFATDATLLSEATTDRDAATAAIGELTAGGWTAMYDALHVALDRFEERAPDRRAIVLLSDGGDNRSTTTLQETVDRLSEGAQVLHIVELITAERPEERQRFGRDDPDADEQDLADLQTLADAAGEGEVASPADLEALTAVYERIAATLVNQYELIYTSESAGPTQLAVQVERDGEVTEVASQVDFPIPDEAEEREPETEPELEPEPTTDDEPDAASDDLEDPEVALEPDGSGRSAAELLEEPWVPIAMIGAVLAGVAFLAYYVSGMLGWRA